MGKKSWFIIAVFLVLLGCMIGAGALSKMGWDFTNLSTTKYQTSTYDIPDAFHGISMKTDSADITFVLSNDGKCTVECYEDEKAKHAVTVEDDTLVVKVVNSKAWYDYLGIHFGTPKITVSLPQTHYASLFIQESTGDIAIPNDFQFSNIDISLSTGGICCSASVSEIMKVKTSTGNIRIENTSAGALDLSASTGEISISNVACTGDVKLDVSTGRNNLTNLNCQNLISDGDTGSIILKNVIATGMFTIERSTGDVKFDGSDAAEIKVETDTGDVTGNLLTDKVFLTETDTGRIDIPKTVTGGKCEISTDTGNIKITVE